MTAYPLIYDLDGSFSIGTNFILNNHERNQQDGFIQVSYRGFSVAHYNDRAPFSGTGIIDGLDRWWTGGLFLQYMFKDRTALFLSYERFTSHVQDAYVLSTHMSYEDIPVKKTYKNFFNREQFNAGFNRPGRWGFNYYFLGNARAGLQRYTHWLSGYSYHYSPKSVQHLLGFEFHRPLLNKRWNFN